MSEQDQIQISLRTAEICLFEMELLIEQTEADHPDPLIDDNFTAVNELRDKLNM